MTEFIINIKSYKCNNNFFIVNNWKRFSLNTVLISRKLNYSIFNKIQKFIIIIFNISKLYSFLGIQLFECLILESKNLRSEKLVINYYSR